MQARLLPLQTAYLQLIARQEGVLDHRDETLD